METESYCEVEEIEEPKEEEKDGHVYKRLGRGVHSRHEQRIKAEKLFIESLGRMNMTEIAKEVGISHCTLIKWEKKYRWRERVSTIERKIEEAVIDKIKQETADKIVEELHRDISFCNRLGEHLLLHLFKHDKDGRIIKDEQGKSLFNTSLSPTDLDKLMAAREKKVKLLRLIQGQSTENLNTNSVVRHEVGLSEREQRYMDITKEFGEIKMQKILNAMLEDEDD